MAVTRSCPYLPCLNLKLLSCYRGANSDNVMTLKICWRKLQTQLCTLALCLSLTNSVRLPSIGSALGPAPVVIAVTICSLVVALPITLLQLAAGQLSQQDVSGVWRAVPVFRGIGYIRLITSFTCCVYNIIYVTLAAVYFTWTVKGPIPFKECTKLQITENGYANKVNASECFNRTFLTPLSDSPQYFGLMAIIVFVLWFFTPLLLYGLKKSTKISLVVLSPIAMAIAIVLLVRAAHFPVPPGSSWLELGSPTLWHAALVQALLSAQITGGYLVSAGGSIYRKSDVRWIAWSITFMNIVAGWAWIIFWLSIGSSGEDTSLISVLVTIYQTTLNDGHGKWFPLLGFALIFLSGLITTLMYLYPVYDKLRRAAGEQWQVTAAASSALGTALTLAMLAHGLSPVVLLDQTLLPLLAVFPTILEIIGFVFIYGWNKLLADIDFLTGTKVTRTWIVSWCAAFMVLLGLEGWWLQDIVTSQPPRTVFWSLVAVLASMLILILFAAIIVIAKEEQYNFLTKIAAAFRPSRLWGPEEPVARYHWMSRRYPSGYRPSLDCEGSVESDSYHHIFKSDKKINNSYIKDEPKPRQRAYSNSSPCSLYISKLSYPGNDSIVNSETYGRRFNTKAPKLAVNGSLRNPHAQYINKEDNERGCDCDRHFSVNLSYVRNGEVTTSL